MTPLRSTGPLTPTPTLTPVPTPTLPLAHPDPRAISARRSPR
ncbi:hypothetical protein SAMN04487983_1016105 [Streptomyces sp. yr375]|nr:hypothetical protein SAMN04487983_1016105 [Streptomyces sp. yr375]